MIKKYILKAVIALGLATLLVAGSAYAWKFWGNKVPPQHSSARIGLINLNRIRNEATAFTKFKEIIERQYKAFHTEISGTQNDLRQKYQEVKDLEKSSNKSGIELQKLKGQLDVQVADLEKHVRERKEKLSDSFSIITAEIESTIKTIIDKISQKKQLNLVLNTNGSDGAVVLFSGDELDITDEILHELDKQLPTVHLPS